MKKNDVFTFTAPNGVEVTGVVIAILRDDRDDKWYLCYAQNRLFDYREVEGLLSIVNVYVDYAILPDYDSMLEEYFHQQDLANDYADREV